MRLWLDNRFGIEMEDWDVKNLEVTMSDDRDRARQRNWDEPQSATAAAELWETAYTFYFYLFIFFFIYFFFIYHISRDLLLAAAKRETKLIKLWLKVPPISSQSFPVAVAIWVVVMVRDITPVIVDEWWIPVRGIYCFSCKYIEVR